MNVINRTINRVLNTLYVIIILAFTLTMLPTTYVRVVTIIIDIECIIALFTNIVLLKKDANSLKFKNISIYNFFVVYATLIMLSINDYIYTFAFVIVLMYMLYFDLRLIIKTVVGFVIINLISVVKILILGHMPSGLKIDVTQLILQVAAIAIYGGVLCVITKKSNEINKSKLNIIEEKNYIQKGF